MRVYDNGIYRDATPQEIAEMEANKPIEIEDEPTIADLVDAINILSNIVIGE